MQEYVHKYVEEYLLIESVVPLTTTTYMRKSDAHCADCKDSNDTVEIRTLRGPLRIK